MSDYETPKCECCGSAMMSGFRRPRVCRNCAATGAATDPTYCAYCKGTGAISTGIDETPLSGCAHCHSTGLSQ